MRFLFKIIGFGWMLVMAIGASSEEIYETEAGDRVSTLDTFQDCDVCPEMVVLPLGVFQMGSTVADANAA